MSALGNCVVCAEREADNGAAMCEVCGKNYDRNGHRDGSTMAVIIWAAERARRFERKRSLVPAKGAK